MANCSLIAQASGEAVYTSDVLVGLGGELYAAVVSSTEPLALVDDVDLTEARKVRGVLSMPIDDPAGRCSSCIRARTRHHCGQRDASVPIWLAKVGISIFFHVRHAWDS
jgi:CO/xanthine dehydrogenase Mo-binding subunit